jgi:predicted transcriptional regulator
VAKRKWRFLTNHALVFLCLHQNPVASHRRIADDVGLSERTVAMVLSDLRHDGYVVAHRQGRCNRYELRYGSRMRSGKHTMHPVGRFLAPLTKASRH